MSDPKQIWFIFKYCHQHKIIDTGREGKYEVTFSTITAGHHLQKPIKGHGLSKDGKPKKVLLPKGQKTLENLTDKGIVVAQKVANDVRNCGAD